MQSSSVAVNRSDSRKYLRLIGELLWPDAKERSFPGGLSTWYPNVYHTPSKQEMRALINVSDLRMKALLTFLYQTGSRITATLKLKVKDVPILLDQGPQDPPYPVYLNPWITKYNFRYVSFINDDLGSLDLSPVGSVSLVRPAFGPFSRDVENLWSFEKEEICYSSRAR